MFIFTKSLLFYPVDYVHHSWRRFAESYKIKTNVTWIYSASYFANVEGASGLIVGFIIVFSRANGKPQRPIRAKKDIFCLDTAEFIDRACSLRDMNKEESKAKVGINYGKSFLKVSPKTMFYYYNDFKLHQSSPSGSVCKFSGAKRMLLQAPETHLNRQEIAYLAKINEILYFISIGVLEMPNLMTGISFHTSTHPYAYYISASKSWDSDDPLRLLTFYARHLDKWMNSLGNFFSCSKLDSTKPAMLLSPPPPPPSALEVRAG